MLRRRVRAESGDAEASDDRGQIDDPRAVGEVREGFARHPKHSRQVRREDCVPVGVVVIRERGRAAEAGVVDEDVDPAPFRDDRRDHSRNRLRVGHVGSDRNRLAAGGLDFPRDAATRLLAPRGERHLRAFSREPPGDRLSDSARSARDEGDLPLEPVAFGHDLEESVQVISAGDLAVPRAP
jgi:hypothetical protein